MVNVLIAAMNYPKINRDEYKEMNVNITTFSEMTAGVLNQKLREFIKEESIFQIISTNCYYNTTLKLHVAHIFWIPMRKLEEVKEELKK